MYWMLQHDVRLNYSSLLTIIASIFIKSSNAVPIIETQTTIIPTSMLDYGGSSFINLTPCPRRSN